MMYSLVCMQLVGLISSNARMVHAYPCIGDVTVWYIVPMEKMN